MKIKRKNLLTLFMAILFLLNCTSIPLNYLDYKRDVPLVISNRVGETIEPEEREAFGLFKGLADFKAATFYSIYRPEAHQGGYEVEIITETLKLISVNRDSLAIEILRDYINRYDEIKDSIEKFEKRWKIIAYDDLNLPITQYEVNIIKQNVFASALGSACCLASIIPSAILGVLLGIPLAFSPEPPIFSAIGPEFNPIVFWGTLISGTALSSWIGVRTGDKIDRSYAVKMIKKSRKPKVVE